MMFPFEDLPNCDLLVDAVYEGGSKGNASDDPIGRIVAVGNQGGFRYAGSPGKRDLKLCVLYSELSDPDWPDELNFESGTFVYYGDNKEPGKDLHDTARRGNLVLRNCFDDLHQGLRSTIPPFLIFTKGEGAGCGVSRLSRARRGRYPSDRGSCSGLEIESRQAIPKLQSGLYGFERGQGSAALA